MDELSQRIPENSSLAPLEAVVADLQLLEVLVFNQVICAEHFVVKVKNCVGCKGDWWQIMPVLLKMWCRV